MGLQKIILLECRRLGTGDDSSGALVKHQSLLRAENDPAKILPVKTLLIGLSLATSERWKRRNSVVNPFLRQDFMRP